MMLTVDCVQTHAAEAARWQMRARCEAVRSMITVGDVQGAVDAVCAVDASILKVSWGAALLEMGDVMPGVHVHAALRRHHLHDM